MFDVAATLKYNQGHWKLYGMNSSSLISSTTMQSLTFITFTVSDIIAILKPLPGQTINRLASQPNTDHYIGSHSSCESKILIIIDSLLLQCWYCQRNKGLCTLAGNEKHFEEQTGFLIGSSKAIYYLPAQKLGLFATKGKNS